jgi:UV DNA damage repair endonuclease
MRQLENCTVCTQVVFAFMIRSITGSLLLDHCSILDHMGIGKDGVIIIHIGVRTPPTLHGVELTLKQGVYGDKLETLARFKENYRTLLSDDIKARLVVENDEVGHRYT